MPAIQDFTIENTREMEWDNIGKYNFRFKGVVKLERGGGYTQGVSAAVRIEITSNRWRQRRFLRRVFAALQFT